MPFRVTLQPRVPPEEAVAVGCQNLLPGTWTIRWTDGLTSLDRYKAAYAAPSVLLEKRSIYCLCSLPFRPFKKVTYLGSKPYAAYCPKICESLRYVKTFQGPSWDPS
ncbi:hypothetical protein H5410_064662 [Solanum commersonii]|uniref:Ribulose bisphosphate carboxylase large chain n=1 Tax=Solanum commersonii TaxID=4109 RepID=A0A9J5VYR4_SOLCO|nr:hypothetical protein H5410_064662 [Solanum commersonii]